MSTRGSIAISRERYRRQSDTGQCPQAVTHPGIADHVRVDGEDERRAEGGRKPRRSPPTGEPRRQDERGEQRHPPRRPEQPAEEPGLGTDLRVVRLPGLDRRAGTRRGLPGVPEPVALWVTNDRPRSLAQADPVAVQRRL